MIVKYYSSCKVWYDSICQVGFLLIEVNPYAPLLVGVWKGNFVQIQRFL